MENDTNILTLAGGMVVAVAMGYIGYKLTQITIAGVGNLIEKAKFHKRMIDGLKDGSIVKINGNYYMMKDVVKAAKEA